MERTNCFDVVFTTRRGIYGKKEGRESVIGSFVAPDGKRFRYTTSTKRRAYKAYLDYCRSKDEN